MNNYAFFLRGVNVGGNATIDMGALKAVLMKERFEDVKTYLNSGNVMIRSAWEKDVTTGMIGQIIREHFNLGIGIMAKTLEELEYILNNDRFDPATESDHSKKIVVMLSQAVDTNKTAIFKEEKKVDEHFYLNGDVLYIYYHNGAGRSKFTNAYIEKKLGVTATARNWNTISKVVEILKTKT